MGQPLRLQCPSTPRSPPPPSPGTIAPDPGGRRPASLPWRPTDAAKAAIAGQKSVGYPTPPHHPITAAAVRRRPRTGGGPTPHRTPTGRGRPVGVSTSTASAPVQHGVEQRQPDDAGTTPPHDQPPRTGPGGGQVAVDALPEPIRRRRPPDATRSSSLSPERPGAAPRRRQGRWRPRRAVGVVSDGRSTRGSDSRIHWRCPRPRSCPSTTTTPSA